MPKPKLTNAQSRERAVAANRVPDGMISKLYQVHLSPEESEVFQDLTPKKRGLIVFRGMGSPAFPWKHYAELCAMAAEVQVAHNRTPHAT